MTKPTVSLLVERPRIDSFVAVRLVDHQGPSPIPRPWVGPKCLASWAPEFCISLTPKGQLRATPAPSRSNCYTSCCQLLQARITRPSASLHSLGQDGRVWMSTEQVRDPSAQRRPIGCGGLSTHRLVAHELNGFSRNRRDLHQKAVMLVVR